MRHCSLAVATKMESTPSISSTATGSTIRNLFALRADEWSNMEEGEASEMAFSSHSSPSHSSPSHSSPSHSSSSARKIVLGGFGGLAVSILLSLIILILTLILLIKDQEDLDPSPLLKKAGRLLYAFQGNII